MSGVFQIDREIFDNNIWNNVAEFRVFFYILGNAVWKEEGVRLGSVLVGRGQYIRSYRNLREDLMYMENNAIKYYSISHIKRIIDKLVTDGRLEKTETELGTLFTIVNYSLYQGFERFEKDNQEQRENGARTEQEQNKNNKNKDNNVNKVNKDIYSEIFEFWNSKEIIQHKKLTDKMKTKIKSVLKDYDVDTLKEIISTYAEIIHDNKYYFTYKWSLEDFLQRGLKRFENSDIAKQNFLNKDFNKTSNQTTATAKKTKFHMSEQRSDNYSNDELENVMDRKRREALERNKKR